MFLFEETETQAWDTCDLTFIGSDGLSFNPITRLYRSVRQQRLLLTGVRKLHCKFWSRLCLLWILTITGNDGEVAQHRPSPPKWNTVMFYSILFLRLYIVISFWRVQNPWFIHYGGSSSIDQLLYVRMSVLLNDSHLSIRTTFLGHPFGALGVLQNTRSATENRGQRMSLWHFIWLSRDTTKSKGLHSNRGALRTETYDWRRYKTEILDRITCRNEFRCSGSSFFLTVLKVVLIKPSWQMFLEVLVRHEKSFWLIEAM